MDITKHTSYMNHLLNLHKLAKVVTPAGSSKGTFYNRLNTSFKGAKGMLTTDEIKAIEKALTADYKALAEFFKKLRSEQAKADAAEKR